MLCEFAILSIFALHQKYYGLDLRFGNNMKVRLGLLVGIFLLWCLPSALLGQSVDTFSLDSSSVEMRFRIFYPVGKSELHKDYMDNANTLHRFQKYLEKSPQIDSITIYSYASPEGSYALNKRLAAERGKTAKQYLLSQIPAERHLPDSLIIIDPTAENWSGLRDLVFYQYQHDDKEEVLAVLDRADITDERRKILLKRLNGGKSWQYIVKELMPHLRYATWISVWQRIEVDKVIEEPISLAMDMPNVPMPKLEPVLLPSPVVEEVDTFMLAVKSNLLFDAVTALNVEVEVPIGNHWSVMMEDVFPWWEKDNKYCFQLLEMGVEGRYWFRNNKYHSQKLKGHFTGAYVMSGKYDFQWDTDLCTQGEFWSAGLTYGYSRRISRLFNLELSASFGYLSTAYRRYYPSDGYDVLYADDRKGRVGYWGPTKLKVSLVMPIYSYKNKKKGGRR